MDALFVTEEVMASEEEIADLGITCTFDGNIEMESMVEGCSVQMRADARNLQISPRLPPHILNSPMQILHQQSKRALVDGRFYHTAQ